MKEMDDAEERVERYLRHAGYTDIQPQPEGEGKFPDFFVEGRIGVEVRRWNINTVDENGNLVNTRNDAYSVADTVQEVLRTRGAPPAGMSWFVRPQFRLPLMKARKLKPAIQKALQSFLQKPQNKALSK